VKYENNNSRDGHQPQDLVIGEEGVVLVVVMIILVGVIVLGMFIMRSASTEVKIARNETVYNSNFYRAESSCDLVHENLDNIIIEMNKLPATALTKDVERTISIYSSVTYPSPSNYDTYTGTTSTSPQAVMDMFSAAGIPTDMIITLKYRGVVPLGRNMGDSIVHFYADLYETTARKNRITVLKGFTKERLSENN
jgi:hypothetical protein